MKIEKLNDNQIRCTLNKRDLIDRELKISELAYGTEKAKGLFQDMMNQAFDQFGFEAEDIPLMIEAIPLSADCIILIVTKVEDPEELDTRFSKFSTAFDEEENDDYMSGELDEEDEAHMEELLNMIRRATERITGSEAAKSSAVSPKSDEKAPGKKADGKSEQLPSVFSFDSLDEISSVCAVIADTFTGLSTVYKNKRTKTYYLILKSQHENADDFTRILNTVSEYGQREKTGYATLAYYDEHYEAIIRDKAVSVLAAI